MQLCYDMRQNFRNIRNVMHEQNEIDNYNPNGEIKLEKRTNKKTQTYLYFIFRFSAKSGKSIAVNRIALIVLFDWIYIIKWGTAFNGDNTNWGTHCIP
jgi:hypothetical protein